MKLKKGDKVITPDGPGMIIEVDVDIENVRYLVYLDSDKFWPHWNVYYTHESLKKVK